MSSILEKGNFRPPPPWNITRGAHQNNYSPSHLPSNAQKNSTFCVSSFLCLEDGGGGEEGTHIPVITREHLLIVTVPGSLRHDPAAHREGAPAADDFFYLRDGTAEEDH
ncbi:hypothetical protein CDAR_457031 [Caerostris darwini]|uniref:Uncharacterized protein n=1 Tax=Caerostris darwini TaxID=1538125 RepID=A0AAV4Q2B6_9ARAC|nr:hypothetical protein CDAR_457031 [Caerostris darwini]